MISFSSSYDYELPISYSGYREEAAQRLALPAGGRDERTPIWWNHLQATQTPWKHADSHQL